MDIEHLLMEQANGQPDMTVADALAVTDVFRLGAETFLQRPFEFIGKETLKLMQVAGEFFPGLTTNVLVTTVDAALTIAAVRKMDGAE